MLAVIQVRYQFGYGKSQKILSSKLVNVVGRHWNIPKSFFRLEDGSILNLKKQGVWVDCSGYGAKKEMCIKAINPCQSLDNIP